MQQCSFANRGEQVSRVCIPGKESHPALKDPWFSRAVLRLPYTADIAPLPPRVVSLISIATLTKRDLEILQFIAWTLDNVALRNSLGLL